MGKKCVKCGQMLPDDASFCPHCTAVQTEKKEVKAPRRWKRKALICFGLLLLFAAVGAAISYYHRPQTYEGGAQIVYEDGGKSYKVLLTFSEGDGMTGHAQGELTYALPEGIESACPCQLYVLDQESGEVVGKAFADKVESCKVDTKPAENSRKMEFIEPMYNESFPNAVYVSDVYYTADSGSNDICWTLNMKNGDTISLSTKLTIEKQEAVTYFSEDTPMETAEELQALLDLIEQDVPTDTPVYLHLPAVTYESDITFGNHTWGIYGSQDGEAETTFAGTVNIKSLSGNFADLFGVRFEGDSGIGLNAYCVALLSGCSFEGWDIAAMAQNGAWVNAMDCTFTNNEIALKFNSSSSYGTAPNYPDNTFAGNGIAVSLERVPGNEVLDFAGSTFSGNDVDIDNKAEHPVSTVNAIFE